MGRLSQGPILKVREAQLQDLRWRRDGGGSSADLATSPARAGVRTVAPGFNRGKDGSGQVGERGPSRCMPYSPEASHPPAEAGGYGSYAGFADESFLLERRSANG